MNREGLLEYMTFQNFFTDQTLFEGVRLLPAGVFGIFRSQGGRLQNTMERYWDYAFTEPEGTPDEAEYLEELDRLFVQAVSRQLVSDVDVGAYLSGGMDSGSLSVLASKHVKRLYTFTAGFEMSEVLGTETGFDERVDAYSVKIATAVITTE